MERPRLRYQFDGQVRALQLPLHLQRHALRHAESHYGPARLPLLTDQVKGRRRIEVASPTLSGCKRRSRLGDGETDRTQGTKNQKEIGIFAEGVCPRVMGCAENRERMGSRRSHTRWCASPAIAPAGTWLVEPVVQIGASRSAR